MKVLQSLIGLWRKWLSFKKGVIHATLDPEGPGSIRLYLVPPKPKFRDDLPSLLVINGNYSVPVGPAWAMVLRVFFEQLQKLCPQKREISEAELNAVEKAVAKKVRRFYHDITEETVISDLHYVIVMAINIAQGKELPDDLDQGGDAYAKYLKNSTGPQRMDLIVAPMIENGKRRCQLNCGCCYAENQKLMVVEKQLSTDDWKKIIDNCKKAGIPALTFTGGEPLTRNDIVDLVKYADWFVTRINTNGYALTEDLAHRLFKASLDGIQITLYSSNPKIHDELVGRQGAWAMTVEGIKNAIKAGLIVSVNTPLVNEKQDYPETINFLAGLGIHYLTCSGLIPTGKATEKISTGEYLDKDSLTKILKESMETCVQLGLDLGFTSPGQLDEEALTKEMGFPAAPICGACHYNMAVSPEGEVVPCQSWLNGQTFGNILTDKWSKIWNNAKRRKISDENSGKNYCPLKGVDCK